MGSYPASALSAPHSHRKKIGRLKLQEGGNNQELLWKDTCQKSQRFSPLLTSIHVPLCFPKFYFSAWCEKSVKDFIFQRFVGLKNAIPTQPVVPRVNMFLGTEQYNPTDLQRSCKPSWQCLRRHKGSVSISPIYGKPKAIYLLDPPRDFL